MPHLKYRIKRASEFDKSIYDYEVLPPGALESLREANAFDSSDLNIKPHTCAFIDKVRNGKTVLYLCGIKRFTSRSNLIARDDIEEPKKSLTEQLEALREERKEYERSIHDLKETVRAQYAEEKISRDYMDRRLGEIDDVLKTYNESIENLEDQISFLSGTRRPDGEGEYRVSGASRIRASYSHDLLFPFKQTYFTCDYCDKRSGKASERNSGQGKSFIEFPMCNCYTPRGGLAISSFTGAVHGTESPGYYAAKNLPNYHTRWEEQDSSTPGSIYTYIPQNSSYTYPERPGQLGFVYSMLNTRAVIAPCCWWSGLITILYHPDLFRVIDLAVAKEMALREAGVRSVPKMSKSEGISDIGAYTYRVGDYPYEASDDGDEHFKRALLGRNYDWTLPETGNNQRVIYALDSYVTGDLTDEVLPEDEGECDSPVWHFDSALWFSPRNCGHPDCQVRYNWGAVCNGGGAFSLANGEACPYYENPLLGVESESEKLCKLSNMYAGDSITAGAILELMWASKGGIPWLQEEWESVWETPYIWTTLPFSPVRIHTSIMRDKWGRRKKMDFSAISYELYAQKTSINLTTGNVESGPAVLLPGGTSTAFERNSNSQQLDRGDKKPDFPTRIKELQVASTGGVTIVWPSVDVSVFNLKHERSEDYVEALQEAKAEPYPKLVWDRDSMVTDIMGYVGAYQFDNGLNCVNLSFLQGDWVSKSEELKEELFQLNTFLPKTQKLLRELWVDILRGQTGGLSDLSGMELRKSLVDSTGLFVFERVPLNPLDRENWLLVFGFNSNSTIAASFVKVQPIFRRGYVYQTGSELMSSWKAVWNGRPSLFFNEYSLNAAGGEQYKRRGDEAKEIETIGTYIESYLASSTDLDYKIDVFERNLGQIEAKIKTYTEKMGESADNMSPALREYYTNKLKRLDQTKLSIASNLQTLKDERLLSLSSASQAYLEVESRKEELKKQIAESQDKIIELHEQLGEAQLLGEKDYINYVKKQIDFEKSNLQSLKAELSKLENDESEEDCEDGTRPPCDEDTSSEEGDDSLFEILDEGDPDTNEDGEIDEQVDGCCDRDDTECIKLNPDLPLCNKTTVSRAYVPFLTSDRPKWRDIDNYRSLTAANTDEHITLSVPKDSGISSWDYISVCSESEAASIYPAYSFGAKAAKRVVVYSTRDFDTGNSSEEGVKGVELTEAIGRWYTLSTCSSLIVLILNPAIFNNHTEAMIFSITASVKYKWKGPNGEKEEQTKLIKFAPFGYSQVSRSFPGYTPGKKAVNRGSTDLDGITYSRIEITDNVEVIEKTSAGRHPWVYFAMPVTEDTTVYDWHNYNNQWYPNIPDRQTAILPDASNVDLYIEFAYIAEVYDQADNDTAKWTSPGAGIKLPISFNHPRSGIQRTVFFYGDQTELLSVLGGGGLRPGEVEDSAGIDGYSTVPIGSTSMASLWPYARYTCRDYEIKYAWRDEHKNIQKAAHVRKGANNTCGGPAKRFTSYALGDHDLGTEFQQAATYSSREDWLDNRSFEQQSGFQVAGKTPTEGFPFSYNKAYAPSGKQGASYYPYTRSEEYTVYVPRHNTYVWEFLDRWRNKYNEGQSSNVLGLGRMLAPQYCNYSDQPLTRTHTWHQYWQYDPKGKATQFLGKSQTRGPVFEMEYREYFDVEARTVYLKPYVARSNYTRNAQWMVLLDRLVPTDEELEETAVGWGASYKAEEGELTYDEWKQRVQDQYRMWRVRVLFPGQYSARGKGDTSKYESELLRLYQYGGRRGWTFTYPLDTDKLEFRYFTEDSDEAGDCCKLDDMQCLQQHPDWPICDDEDNCCESDDQACRDLHPDWPICDCCNTTDYICREAHPAWPLCDECIRTNAEEQELASLEAQNVNYRYELSGSPPPTWDRQKQLDQYIYYNELRIAELRCESLPPEPDDPEDIDYGTWKNLVNALWSHWQATEEKTDLMIEVRRGESKGWSVQIEPTLEFDAEDIPEDIDPCEDQYAHQRSSLQDKVDILLGEIEALTFNSQDDPNDWRANQLITEKKALVKHYKDAVEALPGPPDPSTCADEEDFPEDDSDRSLVASEINPWTGCKINVTNTDAAGSFMLLDEYVYGSPTSKSEQEKRALEKERVFRKLQQTSQRYYQYEQKPFGYNYPWSPYDSCPLFGNTGREMFLLDLCTVGSVISWIPRLDDPDTTDSDRAWTTGGGLVTDLGPEDEPTVPPGSPTFSNDAYVQKYHVPSWWTGLDPDGQPKELVTLLPPPLECTRAVSPLSSEAHNPFYHYIVSDANCTEVLGDISDYDIYDEALSPADVRIVTAHDPDHYGKPYYRSDVGRFTLTPSLSSKMQNISVFGNSVAVEDECYSLLFEEEDITDAGTPEAGDGNGVDHDHEMSQVVSDSNTLRGSELLGIPALSGDDSLYVGKQYPGFCGSYDYGRFFVGYKKYQWKCIHWAWPVNNRDKVERGVRTVKWWLDLESLKEESANVIAGSKYYENHHLAAITSIQAGSYTRKKIDKDDGREVSCGPELTDTKQQGNDKEKKWQTAFYAIVVESERITEGGLRPALVWAQKLDSPDISTVGQFKVPPDGVPAHKVLHSNILYPVHLGQGDESFVDSFGVPSYQTAFSTGPLANRPNLCQQDPLPNLLTSDVPNEAGVYPGFVVSSVNRRFLGKVYRSRDYVSDDLKKFPLVKTKSAAGQFNHTVTTSIFISSFAADLLFVEVDYSDFFTEGKLSGYFDSVTDKAAVQLLVRGRQVESSWNLERKFLTQFPVDKTADPRADASSVLVYYDLDLGLVDGLELEFTFYVRTHSLNFDEGPWGGPEKEYDYEDRKWVDVPANKKTLADVADKIILGYLAPGKCAEVVKVSEAGFVISTGAKCETDGTEYNFFEDLQSDWYLCQWEESEKNVNRNFGWWTDYVGGKVAGTGQPGEGKLGDSLEGNPADEVESRHVTGMATERIRETDQSYNKTQKSQAYPDRCIELPELPQSRLKIEAWDEMNDGANVQDTWRYGGVWTTRVAGPEWVTRDPYPSRDRIWWPAPPYDAGRIVMKGRYWSFGPQYKDFAKVRDHANLPDPLDQFNKYATQYETRGFDSLLRVIQEWESKTADQRRSAYNQEVNKRKGVEGLSNNPLAESIKQGAGGSAQGALAGMAAQGIYDSIAAKRNYTVFNRREYVYIDEVGISPSVKNLQELEERERQQRDLYNRAVDLNPFGSAGNSLTLTAIIPPHDWYELVDITGGNYLKTYPGSHVDNHPITIDQLRAIRGHCIFRWKDWDWAEIASFSFRNEESEKYPLGGPKDWENVINRQCGSRWTHDDGENVVIEDCSDAPDIGGANKCQDPETKWTEDDLDLDVTLCRAWPVTVSSDSGQNLRRPDPWWRF